MFKNYLRYENRETFGLVVIDGDKIGWSLCRPKDKFDKRKGLTAALGRAKSGINWENWLTYKIIEDSINYKHHDKRKVLTSYGYHDSRLGAVLDKIKHLKSKLRIGV